MKSNPRPHRRRGAASLLALCALQLGMAGCYRYVPTRLDLEPPGQDVRLLVTRQGAFELSEVTDINAQVPVVRGRVVGEEGEDLMLAVSVGRRQVGFHQARLDQTVRVPQGEILSVERREFDAAGTGLLVAGTAALAGAVVFLIMDSFGDTNSTDDPPLDEGRLPIRLFSIPIGH